MKNIFLSLSAILGIGFTSFLNSMVDPFRPKRKGVLSYCHCYKYNLYGCYSTKKPLKVDLMGSNHIHSKGIVFTKDIYNLKSVERDALEQELLDSAGTSYAYAKALDATAQTTTSISQSKNPHLISSHIFEMRLFWQYVLHFRGVQYDTSNEDFQLYAEELDRLYCKNDKKGMQHLVRSKFSAELETRILPFRKQFWFSTIAQALLGITAMDYFAGLCIDIGRTLKMDDKFIFGGSLLLGFIAFPTTYSLAQSIDSYRCFYKRYNLHPLFLKPLNSTCNNI